MTTPNINKIKEEGLNTLDKEFDLEKSLNRYASVTPELIESMNNLGLTDGHDASRTLFVSDYIFTSSEVSYDINDDQRRSDLASMFVTGLSRSTSDVLLKIFYLASKTQSMIRQSDLFMAGKGVERNASLITLKDIFIDAYLEICSELLGEGPCGWELAVLASSMKKTLPGKEYEYFKSAPKRTDSSAVFPFIWNLLIEYSNSINTKVNDEILIPDIDKSSTLMGLFPSKKDVHFSTWNFDKRASSLKENKEILLNLQEFVSQSDDTRPFIYLRANILNSEEQVFLVRDPENTKPFFFLKSSVDEVNVTEILTLLRNRALDVNPDVLPVEKLVKEVEEVVKKELYEEKEVEFDKEVEVDVPTETKAVSESGATDKKGFFGKILSIFGRGKSSSQEGAPKEKKPKKTKKTVKDKKTIKEKKLIEEKVKVRREIQPGSNLPNFVSYSLGIIGVGDLNLFQIFDTVRESNYNFSGVLYSNFKNNSSTFYASKSIDDPKSLTKVLDGLDIAVEKTINHFAKDNVQIMPGEMLFRGRTIDTNFVLIFEGNKDHLVAIMGTTYIKDESVYTGPESEEPETFQRRTLKMRTNQLLKTLQSVPRFEEAFTRVLGEELLNQCSEFKFEHAILNIYS